MARTFTVDNVTFTINTEATFTDDHDYNEATVLDNPIWPNSSNEVPALKVCCGGFEAKAWITATLAPAGTPQELARWIAGYAQTVVYFGRNAHYVDAAEVEVAQISCLLQHGIPIRDGEPGEFPGYGDAFPAGPPTPVKVTANSRDEPFVLVPIDLNTNPAHPINATLRSVTGTDVFEIWLAVYRAAAEHPAGQLSDRACLVPLTKVEWRSNYSTQSTAAAPLQFAPPAHLQIGVPELLQITPRYSRQPLGDGRNFPDTRERASANDMSYWELRELGGYELKWIDDDEEGPVNFRELPPVPDEPNFLPW